MDIRTIARSLWRRFFALLETGFDVMARYPYDLTELHWNTDLYEPPADEYDSSDDDPEGPTKPTSGRTIKVVPSPASQRYQAARPTHIPVRHPRRKQPV